jgi:hypothetical protein
MVAVPEALPLAVRGHPSTVGVGSQERDIFKCKGRGSKLQINKIRKKREPL